MSEITKRNIRRGLIFISILIAVYMICWAVFNFGVNPVINKYVDTVQTFSGKYLTATYYDLDYTNLHTGIRETVVANGLPKNNEIIDKLCLGMKLFPRMF